MAATDVWKLRVDAIRDAQQRSRNVFAIATILSVATIISNWNTCFSWAFTHATSVITKEQEAADRVGKLAKDDIEIHADKHGLQKAMIEQRLRDWVSSERVEIPLLGVSISGSDIAVLGSITLLVVSIWMFFCVRRENRLIWSTLSSSGGAPPEDRALIYHGIVSYMVFSTLSEDDSAKYTIKPHPADPHPAVIIRAISKILFFLPGIAVTIAILADVYSATFPPMFRAVKLNGQALWHVIQNDLPEVGITWAVSLVLNVIVFVICCRVVDFMKKSEAMVKEFEKMYAADLMLS